MWAAEKRTIANLPEVTDDQRQYYGAGDHEQSGVATHHHHHRASSVSPQPPSVPVTVRRRFR